MRNVFEGLDPEVLWRYFDAVTQIPRCSGHEERILGYLVAEAQQHDLPTRRDRVGNLVILVPAARGCESAATIVLQGHVDMVCEKNRDVEHDFERQGIEVVRDGEWLTARGTTLGGDNGVAVAAMLALLDDPPARHGPLELLFTVDEERGLTGAGGIEPHMLQGRTMLNLDSEEEGFVTVGCAGGGDTIITLEGRRGPMPSGWEVAQLGVRGLQGGHSGVDIIGNRANALRCLGRVLDRLGRELEGLRIIAVEGGSKRNAIPREASATVALPAGGRQRSAALLPGLLAELEAEFAPTDPGARLVLENETTASKPPFDEATSSKIVTLLLAVPTGVLAMNREIAGLVETSSNLGVLEQQGDRLRFVSCTRSSVAPALEAVRQGIRALGEALGARVELEAGYPGWNPDLGSKLLATFKRVHREVTGKEPQVMAIHAGLECGILGERFPGMDMISFGPDLKGVHAPGERLSVPSTARFFVLLKTLLESLS